MITDLLKRFYQNFINLINYLSKHFFKKARKTNYNTKPKQL